MKKYICRISTNNKHYFPTSSFPFGPCLKCVSRLVITVILSTLHCIALFSTEIYETYNWIHLSCLWINDLSLMVYEIRGSVPRHREFPDDLSPPKWYKFIRERQTTIKIRTNSDQISIFDAANFQRYQWKLFAVKSSWLDKVCFPP